MAARTRPSKKTIAASSVRRSSKVYEPSIESLCDESILAELLQTPVPWTYKDLYSSQNQTTPTPNKKQVPPPETQIWKMAGILDRGVSGEGDRSPMSTDRSTERSTARSSRLAATARTSMISSVRSGTPKEQLSDTNSQSIKQRAGPPPERYIVAHMSNYRRFIKDERWWDTHGIDIPLGGNDKRKLMVLRYGMRVPFPVETVFRWFEEIMVVLRARAEAMIRESPWRSWTVPALVIMLREYAWSNDDRQKLIQSAQAKGLTSLCVLTHRWRLRVVEEQEWRPASRRLVRDGASEAVNSSTCPRPREQAIDERLSTETAMKAELPASPLPYTSDSDWSDLGPGKEVNGSDLLSLRSLGRANSRMCSDMETTQLSRHHGGAGTGRELIPLPPSKAQVGPLIQDDDSEEASFTYSASATATDYLLAKMQTRESARAAYMQEVPPLQEHTPQTHTKANKVAFQSSPHSFDKGSARSLNNSESVRTGALFSPLVGKRAGTVGGGYGVGDGGGVASDGGVDWYMFNGSPRVGQPVGEVEVSSVESSLPFSNFFPTDDLTGEGLVLRASSIDGSHTSKGQRSAQRSNNESDSVPEGSLTQQLLSPDNETSLTADEPAISRPHSETCESAKAVLDAKPRGRFEPQHYIHSPSTPKSATRRGSEAGMLESAKADRRAVQYLLEACGEGQMEHCVEMFKTVGPACLVHWVDGRGRGALHYAALNGHVELCNWLLSNGAVAMAKDNDGRCSLHLSALNGNENALRALMNHPAARPKRPDPVDNFNRTPLHLAAWFGQKHTTEALMRNQANVNAKDAQGYTPLERASMGRRTALLEFLQRQQILPLDFNTAFQVYHTYDEHSVVKAEKLQELAKRTKEVDKTKALTEAISARAARSVELYHQSGVVPSLGPITSNETINPPPVPQPISTAEEQKRRRRPAPLPHMSSQSAFTHPTAVVGGLDELLTDAMAFPFPRAVHLRNRRDRESASSDSDDDSLTKDGSLNSDRNDCDSIASDDFDQDGYLPETATSLEEHRVAVARAGGNMDGIEEVKVSVPGSGGAAELECAELISRHVNEYIGGPQVAGVGAELRILFAATPAQPAAFSRGKARGPGFVHTIPSPTVDPRDITGAKARTRLRLLGGKHRSAHGAESSIAEDVGRTEELSEELSDFATSPSTPKTVASKSYSSDSPRRTVSPRVHQVQISN